MHNRSLLLALILHSAAIVLASGGCARDGSNDGPAGQSSSGAGGSGAAPAASTTGSGGESGDPAASTTGSGGASGEPAASTTGAGGQGGDHGGGGMAGGTTGAAGGADGGGSAGLPPVSVYIAGDSTVMTYVNSPIHQAGWGQMLGEFFDARVSIENRAIGGRTARRFIEEGRLTDILDDIHSGDFLLVQFGTNDSNKNATYERDGVTIPYYLDPATDFRSYLGQYIAGARERAATPVLVTPPPRRSCTGDSHEFGNGLSAYAQAMRELGSELDVAVIDLNERTLVYLRSIGCVAAGTDFFLVRADGTVDGTHFQETGARVMAGLVADGAADAGLLLARYRK